MMYYIFWSIAFIYSKLYLGFNIVGRENIPRKGAFIFVANHASYIDPFLLGTSTLRSVYYMAQEELFQQPLGGWLLRMMNAFPVRRGEADPAALRTAIKMLKKGKPLVIFPEGTRAYNKNLRPGKPGIGFMVAKAMVPVIPAYVSGSFEAWPRTAAAIRRHPVSVYIGKPIEFDPINFARKDKDSYQIISDEIMREIARLKKTYEDNTG